MAIHNHIEHAEHNEKVCRFLSKKPDFSDWIITTAFYSAVHYVRYLLLPYTDGTTIFDCFETLFTSKKYPNEGRHGFSSRFVKEQHPNIYIEYKQLHDYSNTARYFNYSFPRETSTAARELLDSVKIYVLETKVDQ